MPAAYVLPLKKGVQLTATQRAEFAEQRAEWRELYGEAVEGGDTIVCDDCGAMVVGDGRYSVIQCLQCFLPAQLRNLVDWKK